MPLMHPDLDIAAYVRCLRRIYGIVAAWEEQARCIAPDWLREILVMRERQSMLDLDLASFGDTPPLERARLPPFHDVYRILGAMYVMEGSTLGGQLISRHVEKYLGFKTGIGDAFFLGHGDQTGSLWKEFCRMLETRVPESHTEFVVLGAKAMLSTFGEWMQGVPASLES
jgi:heme oxygenase